MSRVRFRAAYAERHKYIQPLSLCGLTPKSGMAIEQAKLQGLLDLFCNCSRNTKEKTTPLGVIQEKLMVNPSSLLAARTLMKWTANGN